MTTVIRKEITSKVCDQLISQMAKNLLDAFIAERKKELRRLIESNNDYGYKMAAKDKLNILNKAEGQEFYNNLIEETVNEISNQMNLVSEKLTVSFANAEFFNFIGRIK